MWPLRRNNGEIKTMTETGKMSVVEMYDSGMEWPAIAEELGTDVDDAMQRYRDQAYDHWDTGWGIEASDSTARFDSGAVDVWTDSDASIRIEEVRKQIPLTIVVEDDESRTLANANLTADKARELAATLNECAEILEEKNE